MNIEPTLEKRPHKKGMISLDRMIVRKLEYEDYNKGFFELLSQLTSAEKPSFEDFKKHIDLINQRNVEQIYVATFDENTIVGTICVFVEVKFIHGLSKIGHIEDFVVEEKVRRNRIGTKLMDIAKKYCENQNCYKIILDCEDKLIPFYQRFGFKKKANSMQLYYI